MKKVLFLILLTVVLFSCGKKNDYSSELKTIDSLKKEISTNSKLLASIDTAKVAKSKNVVAAYVGFITQILKDTISKEEALLLSDFRRLKKNFEKFDREKGKIDAYIGYNVQQIENLEYDLKNGMIEQKDSATKYLNQELTANAEVIALMKTQVVVMPTNMHRYDSLKPLVEIFIKKINSGTVPPDLLKLGE